MASAAKNRALTVFRANYFGVGVGFGVGSGGRVWPVPPVTVHFMVILLCCGSRRRRIVGSRHGYV